MTSILCFGTSNHRAFGYSRSSAPDRNSVQLMLMSVIPCCPAGVAKLPPLLSCRTLVICWLHRIWASLNAYASAARGECACTQDAVPAIMFPWESLKTAATPPRAVLGIELASTLHLFQP